MKNHIRLIISISFMIVILTANGIHLVTVEQRSISNVLLIYGYIILFFGSLFGVSILILRLMAYLSNRRKEEK
jgi:hypothetical protein